MSWTSNSMGHRRGRSNFVPSNLVESEVSIRSIDTVVTRCLTLFVVATLTALITKYLVSNLKSYVES
ncbi:hypothetical protein Glove_420g54 [Diversispora epigaea]|uniref:Uncharacterized protein n=1 Tax=Diversispora epigaea TaxID=1348612 RepID=A0A397GVV8_9GLOM|nr:hypothetical protein Glove_420g54 [Diversispora epigaea]